jgi:hypothetical protein
MGTVSSYKKLKPYQLIYIRRKIIENRGFNTSIFTYYDIIRQNQTFVGLLYNADIVTII